MRLTLEYENKHKHKNMIHRLIRMNNLSESIQLLFVTVGSIFQHSYSPLKTYKLTNLTT